MSSAEVENIIKAAFREAQKSRAKAGLRLNRNAPKRYRITVWLAAWQYLDIVQTSKRTGLSVSRVLKNYATAGLQVRLKKAA